MKQETLEEAAEKYANHSLKEERQKDLKLGFKDGAKWQAEISYSDEENISSKSTVFEVELYKFINNHVKKGLSKKDLIHKMKYVLESCEMS